MQCPCIVKVEVYEKGFKAGHHDSHKHGKHQGHEEHDNFKHSYEHKAHHDNHEPQQGYHHGGPPRNEHIKESHGFAHHETKGRHGGHYGNDGSREHRFGGYSNGDFRP
jgi:hypothetical protein